MRPSRAVPGAREGYADRRAAVAADRRAAEEDAGGRVCSRCQEWRSRQEFTDGAWEKRGGSYACRPCRKAYNRVARLQQRYGLTERAYDAMFVGQGGLCALCRVAHKRPLVVDHDHKTGVVRGLLCDTCNTALGRLGDDEAGLMAALAYVRGEWR